MIKTKNRNVKRIIRHIYAGIAFLLTLCFALQIPLDQIGRVEAAEKVYYISEVKAFQAGNMEDARKACENEGYVCSGKDLNAGSGKDIVVILGYKVTENRDEALYDISLLHMNDGYQIKDYAAMNAELEKSNHGAAEAMDAAANEFIINYNEGSPKAKEAYEGLNLISIPEKGNVKLGDYIIQGKADVDFFAKIVTTQRSKPYGDPNMMTFIHAKYDISTGYFKKIYAASGETPREAQLGLLEQGCTEFCDIDLNKDAGGNSVYFGYKGFSLDENKISMASTEEARNKEKNKQLNEAVYDIICTVGEKFHPEGIISERYQIYYAPVARKDKKGNLVGTNLNDGTTGPEIYMYYTSTYAAKNNNDKAAKDQSIQLSSMPKDYLKSPITKIGFALYDYVPYSKELEAASSDNEDIIAWEYVMKSDNKAQADLNEGAVSFDNDHLTTDNRITMFVQREAGNVKPSAEITGGYNTALVAESKLYLNK